MRNKYINDLVNLKGVIIKKIKNLQNSIEIYADLPISEQICPCCGHKTTKIHDYYSQPIAHIPVFLKPTTIILRKVRYECKHCGKSFYPENDIVARFKRKTKELIAYVTNQLREAIPASTIAKSLNIDANFISKLLPYLAVTTTTLPRVLCIDEFKGNSGNYKYQVALVDGETHKIVDIVKCRHKHFLFDYFKQFPKSELNKVEFLVSDLWKTYKDIGSTFFKNATFIADHFHWARYVVESLDSVRKEVQSTLDKDERIHFKHSRFLLLSNHDKLPEDRYEELEYMLNNYSEKLRIAYMEKEDLLSILHSKESPEIKKAQFSEWIKFNLESDIPQLVECAKTFLNWSKEIKNSLEVPYSNGPIEGINNKIKVLKRITYGMPKFINFKARIMLLD